MIQVFSVFQKTKEGLAVPVPGYIYILEWAIFVHSQLYTYLEAVKVIVISALCHSSLEI